MKEEKFNSFSVPLGLLDYINPICYCITMVTIIKHTRADMGQPYSVIFLIGAIISIFFGFIIPTGKVIVGLGLIKFRMPVALVFCVNTGIFISGLMLLRYVLNLNGVWLCALIAVIAVLLALIYRKSRKINTIAVLTGAAGYVMLPPKGADERRSYESKKKDVTSADPDTYVVLRCSGIRSKRDLPLQSVRHVAYLESLPAGMREQHLPVCGTGRLCVRILRRVYVRIL